MQRTIGLLTALLASGAVASAETPSAEVVLAKMAGFSEASLTASNVALDVRMRAASDAAWRIEAPVLMLADGAINLRQNGIEKGYVTCNTTNQGDVITTTTSSARYFVGHRVEMRASDCNFTSCKVAVTATLALDGGVHSEPRPGCVDQAPDVRVSEARIEMRVDFDAPVRIALGSEGELVVALSGLDYQRRPGR